MFASGALQRAPGSSLSPGHQTGTSLLVSSLTGSLFPSLGDASEGPEYRGLEQVIHHIPYFSF